MQQPLCHTMRAPGGPTQAHTANKLSRSMSQVAVQQLVHKAPLTLVRKADTVTPARCALYEMKDSVCTPSTHAAALLQRAANTAVAPAGHKVTKCNVRDTCCNAPPPRHPLDSPQTTAAAAAAAAPITTSARLSSITPFPSQRYRCYCPPPPAPLQVNPLKSGLRSRSSCLPPCRNRCSMRITSALLTVALCCSKVCRA